MGKRFEKRGVSKENRPKPVVNRMGEASRLSLKQDERQRKKSRKSDKKAVVNSGHGKVKKLLPISAERRERNFESSKNNWSDLG